MNIGSESEGIIFANAQADFLQSGKRLQPGDIVTFGGTINGNEVYMDEHAWTVVRSFDAVNSWLLARVATTAELRGNQDNLAAFLALIGITQYVTLSVPKKLVVDIHSAAEAFYLQTGKSIMQVNSFEEMDSVIDEFFP